MQKKKTAKSRHNEDISLVLLGFIFIYFVSLRSTENKLLDQFNTRYVTSQRNKVMFQLMLNTGLRASEIVLLRWEDVNLSPEVMVRERLWGKLKGHLQ